MARAKKSVKVDREKFVKLLNLKNKTMRDMSEEIGGSNNLITTSLRRGTFTMVVANCIESTYGITPDMYAPDPIVEEAPVEEEAAPAEAVVTAEPITCSEISYAVEMALLKVMPEIAVSVKMAMADVLKEFAENYRIYKVGGVQTICPRKDDNHDEHTN